LVSSAIEEEKDRGPVVPADRTVIANIFRSDNISYQVQDRVSLESRKIGCIFKGRSLQLEKLSVIDAES
jgi:hypothetical protein